MRLPHFGKLSDRQLNLEERLKLYRLRQEINLLLRAIAEKMSRSHTVMSCELQRNQDPCLKTDLPDRATSQGQETDNDQV